VKGDTLPYTFALEVPSGISQIKNSPLKMLLPSFLDCHPFNRTQIWNQGRWVVFLGGGGGSPKTWEILACKGDFIG
jgi:hypothetical protein